MNNCPEIPRLSALTTLCVGGPPQAYIEAMDEDEIIAAVTDTRSPILVLAGGSNLLVADEGYAGTVLHIRSRGIEICGTEIKAAAGEPWDNVVAAAVDAGLTGIELLSGIPGSAGATPIQNVGAYEQEVAETIASVRAYDPSQGSVIEIPGDECEFDYRTSRFQKDGCIVLSVTYKLRRAELSEPIKYKVLLEKLNIKKDEQVPLADARMAVRAVRGEKGMLIDDHDPDSVSAGSFFKNPLLEPEHAARLQRESGLKPIKEAPRSDGLQKFSAAQLILAAGFDQGHQGPGRARISDKHVLALVNEGGARAEDVAALARQVKAAVASRFGVELLPEPTLVGIAI